jgi:hypothetical protein
MPVGKKRSKYSRKRYTRKKYRKKVKRNKTSRKKKSRKKTNKIGGASGASGTSGASGASGTSGASGASGTSGASGANQNRKVHFDIISDTAKPTQFPVLMGEGCEDISHDFLASGTVSLKNRPARLDYCVKIHAGKEGPLKLGPEMILENDVHPSAHSPHVFADQRLPKGIGPSDHRAICFDIMDSTRSVGKLISWNAQGFCKRKERIMVQEGSQGYFPGNEDRLGEAWENYIKKMARLISKAGSGIILLQELLLQPMFSNTTRQGRVRLFENRQGPGNIFAFLDRDILPIFVAERLDMRLIYDGRTGMILHTNDIVVQLALPIPRIKGQKKLQAAMLYERPREPADGDKISTFCKFLIGEAPLNLVNIHLKAIGNEPEAGFGMGDATSVHLTELVNICNHVTGGGDMNDDSRPVNLSQGEHFYLVGDFNNGDGKDLLEKTCKIMTLILFGKPIKINASRCQIQGDTAQWPRRLRISKDITQIEDLISQIKHAGVDGISLSDGRGKRFNKLSEFISEDGGQRLTPYLNCGP